MFLIPCAPFATCTDMAADNANDASRTVRPRPEESPTVGCRGFRRRNASSTCTPRHLAGTCRNPLERPSSLIQGAASLQRFARSDAAPLQSFALAVRSSA